MEYSPSPVICQVRQKNRLAYGLIPLLNLLDQRGIDIDRFLDSVAVPKFGIVDPAYTITIQQEADIIAKAMHLLDDTHIGLRLAKLTRLHNFSAFGLAMKSCSTLADILELVNRYPNLVLGNCNITQRHEKGIIISTFESGDSSLDRILLERDMACAALLTTEALGTPFPLLEVHFAFPEPEDIELYRNIFCCPVKFEQRHHEMWIEADTLDIPLPTADPLAKAFYEAQCATMSRALKQPFSYAEATRERLYRTTPIPSLEQVAEALNMTPRTLQRRLKEENARFGELLQETRLQRAEEYLADGAMRIDRIAEALGFKDSVAFSHAFKKWTGISPRRWKEQFGF